MRQNSVKNQLADAGIKSHSHSYWWSGKTPGGRDFIIQKGYDYNDSNCFRLIIKGRTNKLNKISLDHAIKVIQAA